MKIVQIVSGGYGLKRDNGLPAKLILRGEIVQLDDAEAERLVTGGFAVYCKAHDETTQVAEQEATSAKPAEDTAPVKKKNRKLAVKG